MKTKRTFSDLSEQFNKLCKEYSGNKDAVKPSPLAEGIMKYGIPDKIIIDTGTEFKEVRS